MNRTVYFTLLIAVSACAVFGSEPERLNLAPNPSFDDMKLGINGWSPVGVQTMVEFPLSLSQKRARSGEYSLAVAVGPSGVTSGTEYYSSYNAGEGKRRIKRQDGIRGARTIAYRMDRDIRRFNASAWVYASPGQEITLQVSWYTRLGRKRPVVSVSEESTPVPVREENGWRCYELSAIRPHNAHQAELVIVTQGHEPFYIDDVRVELIRAENPLILVDQLGYEIGSETKFVLLQLNSASSLTPDSFEVIDLDRFQTVLKGRWKQLGYLPKFDRTYWRGSIDGLTSPGRYAVRMRQGREDFIESEPFEIGDDLLIEHTARLAYEFYYYQRCGMAIPGFHAACHLDDARMPDGSHRDLSGGWHDAGDYNKYNGYTPESFYALILAYDRKKEFFDQFDRDKDGVCDLLDEAVWGAKFLMKCLDNDTLKLIGTISTGYGYWDAPGKETDNQPGKGNDRPVRDGFGNRPAHLVSAFALLGKNVPSGKPYLDLAERLYGTHGGGIKELIHLYRATNNTTYKTALDQRISSTLSADDGGLSQFRDLAEFVLAFPDDKRIPAIQALAPKRLDQLQQSSRNHFGLMHQRDRDGIPTFFMHYQQINNWYVGGTREHLDAAYDGILIDCLGEPGGRAIAENQVHWLLGRNPFNTSLMEGVGKRFVPSYHHRYNAIPGNPRGAVPGALLNGITRAWPWTDRPWLDLHPVPTGDFQCNEPWLPHNNRMMFLLSIW